MIVTALPWNRTLRIAAVRIILLLATAVTCGLSATALGQIGGLTAADGPFLLDDFEDLDTTAGGVLRPWIYDLASDTTYPLEAISPTTAGLTLASDQSPQGVVRYAMKTKHGYLNYSFGVPMPGLPGVSTLLSPGDISSFSSITFYTTASATLVNQKLQVILETYPGPVYPKLYWDYTLAPGPGFQRVTLDLRRPDLVTDPGGLLVEELLKQTRYLAFYYYAGPEAKAREMTVYVDDIRLISSSAAKDWALY